MIIDKIAEECDEDYGDVIGPLRKACGLKFRDILHETVSEYNRKNSFVRIYPARNSKIYPKNISMLQRKTTQMITCCFWKPPMI